jgi:hypothetical protein
MLLTSIKAVLINVSSCLSASLFMTINSQTFKDAHYGRAVYWTVLAVAFVVLMTSII